MDVYRKNPNILYARIEHPRESGVYRSDDAGASWRKMGATNPRPMYFSQIRVDPTNDLRVYVLGVQLHVSDDGGKTFENDGARNIHVDHHAMWINPANPDHLLLGSDGGVGISYDRSRTYVFLSNMPIGQFYHVSYDMQSPYTVCGGLQDNNTWCGPSAVRSADGIANDDWFIIGGGDGFVGLVDPTDHRIMYAESQDGRMNRVDRVTNERKAIRPEAPEGDKPYRWNWDTPLILSPHDPATVFVAANHVLRSTDRGHSWAVASPDLTSAIDRETLELMGVKASEFSIAKHDGVSTYGTIVSFAESPNTRGLYYAGTDDGNVQVSRDGGKSWTNVTAKVPGVPKGTYVSEVVPSRFDEAVVYATFDGHRSGDFGSYVFASGDHGSSWRSIAGDLPTGEVARTIAEDLRNPDVLYLGTESGLFVTLDRGRKWTRVRANLPTVPVYEIAIHPRDNDLILATHGRSVWILDDLAPIQEYARASTTDAHLFNPGPAIQRNASNERMRRFEGDLKFLGANPSPGVPLTYFLRNTAKEARLVVRDGAGATIREISGEAMKGKGEAGLNGAVWDLRIQPLRPLSGQQGQGGGGGFGGGGLIGPLVLPGEYTVTLVADGRDMAKTTVAVKGDPEIQITDADRRRHFEILRELHGLQGTAQDATEAVTTMHEQITWVQEKLKAAPAATALASTVGSFTKELTPVRTKFGVATGGGFGGGFGGGQNVRARIGQLKGGIMGSTSLPTETQMRMISESRAALSKAIDEANGLIARLPALYEQLAKGGLYPVAPKPIRGITTTDGAGR
jgi:photosystem II stability/assembly factor-like uncharacterized protein